MTEEVDLKVGSFYWVLIALDPDCEDWENEKMPARYAGNDEWQFIGQEGFSDWPVRWIGDEIFPNRHTLFPTGRGKVELDGYTWVGDQIPPKNVLIDLYQDSQCSFFFNCIYKDSCVMQREIDGSFKPVIGWMFDCWKLSEDQ